MALVTHRIEGSDLEFGEVNLVGRSFLRLAPGFTRSFTGENLFTSVVSNTSRPLRIAATANKV